MVKNTPQWLILSQYYAPEIGAPQIRLRSLARELKNRGFDVEILTAMPNYPAGKIFPKYKRRWKCEETIDGLIVRRRWIYAATGKSAFSRLANYLSFTITALLAALFSPKPHVLFIEGQPLSLGVVGILLKRLRGVPYIFNVPDLQIDVARQLGFMNNRRFLNAALKLEQLIIQDSLSVSTVTHQFIEYFVNRGLPRSQVSFLPNGADVDFLIPQPPDQELLERWKLHGKKVFLYVGTHAYYHGLDTLIQAAALLRDHDEIAFLLIGDGPERSRLIQLVYEIGLQNVVFGESPYEEMARLYSIAYASVATLRKMEVAKSMRLSKVFPSMSCSVPTIYAGIGEAADLILEHRCGVVVEPEMPELLANAISKLASNPSLRDEMGRAGRTLIEREYSWSIIVLQWLDELKMRGLHDGRCTIVS
jgi:glycosyltransferase involved in cell wall biosynthesis